MNYIKTYNNIIEKRKIEIPTGYTENHHIIPRSLGGSDISENLVKLTAREHFICHYLLTKMYDKETFEWYKMTNAFLMMKCSSVSTQERYFNSHLYEYLRKNFSKIMSNNQIGDKNSQFGTIWISNNDLRESKTIKKYDTIPDGWERGRNNWNKNLCVICKSVTGSRDKTYCDKCRDIYSKTHKPMNDDRKQKQRELHIGRKFGFNYENGYLFERRKELIINSGIDFSMSGWTNKVSALIGMTPSSIYKWIRRYMPDFYELNCLKTRKQEFEDVCEKTEVDKIL